MNKPLAFTFIIVTLTIDAMGIGLIIPVMPDLLQDIEGGDLGQDLRPQCLAANLASQE